MFELAKTVHASDGAATVFGHVKLLFKKELLTNEGSFISGFNVCLEIQESVLV
jgi:hypothetical protein